jgi:uncharacterized protein (DUF427 family)
MVRATWNDTVLAESDSTLVVDGNHYFPPESLHMEFFRPADTTSVCGWKGTARYHDVVVGGQTNADAAWYYADPKPGAERIRGHVAFWKGVKVE